MVFREVNLQIGNAFLRYYDIQVPQAATREISNNLKDPSLF